MTEPKISKITVSIVDAALLMRPPVWHVQYEVRNLQDAVIWLVVDESLVLVREGAHIELSYARGKMRPGVQVFGYFNPNVVEVGPSESMRRSVEIRWPCRLSDIWNDEREVAPPPGEYEVTVRVGFGSTPAPMLPSVGEDVEAPVLRWQEEAVSPPVWMTMPPLREK